MILKVLRIIGQLVIWGLILLTGGLLFFMAIPGNGGFCDAEQGLLVFSWGVFLLASLLLILNSVYFFNKKDWTKYRLVSIVLIISLLVLSFGLRPLIFALFYGQESTLIENTEDNGLYVDLKLFENGKFYSEIYDLSCEEEIPGEYIIKEDLLELEYEKDSYYLGKKFRIVGNEFISLDSNLILRIKN
jgi:hypothetical protein